MLFQESPGLPEPRESCSQEPLAGSWPCQHPDFELLASRMWDCPLLLFELFTFGWLVMAALGDWRNWKQAEGLTTRRHPWPRCGAAIYRPTSERPPHRTAASLLSRALVSTVTVLTPSLFLSPVTVWVTQRALLPALARLSCPHVQPGTQDLHGLE